jgi:hypothetical protein
MLRILALLLLLAIPVKTQSQQVENFLILSIDISASIGEAEYNIQQRGYASAFSNTIIRNRLLKTPTAIMIYEWSEQQAIMVPCIVINSERDIDYISNIIANRQRPAIGSATGIALAMRFAYNYINENCQHIEADRIILDISLDGIENVSPPNILAETRQKLLDNNFTINVLALTNEFDRNYGVFSPEEFLHWLRVNVQGGFNSFTLEVNDIERFDQVLFRKITLELSNTAIDFLP